MMLNFNCPRCGKPMEQEAQHEHSVMGFDKHYDYEKKEWVIPKKITLSFVRKYWCRGKECSMQDRYVFNDGNYVYERKEEK